MRTLIPSNGLRGVAIHEAGHALAAVSCGLAVESVVIRDDLSGECRIRFLDQAPIRSQLLVYGAGPIANRLLCPQWRLDPWGDTAPGDHTDARNWLRLLDSLPAVERDAVARSVIEDTERLIRQRRYHVRRLAATLLLDGVVPGPVATFLVGGVPCST